MNKKGWGLRAELGFLLLFLVCLLVATIGLHKLGIFGSSSRRLDSGYDYSELESRVSDAARKYYNNYYPNGSHDTVIISVETLKSNGYMSPIYDNLNRECKGYAKVLSNKTCVSYINCTFYKTTGYSGDYE